MHNILSRKQLLQTYSWLVIIIGLYVLYKYSPPIGAFIVIGSFIFRGGARERQFSREFYKNYRIFNISIGVLILMYVGVILYEVISTSRNELLDESEFAYVFIIILPLFLLYEFKYFKYNA